MLNTLEYFWPDLSPKRAERLLLETGLPGSFLLRRDSGDTFVSFLDSDSKVKHYFINQRADSALYQARPELKCSIVDTFMFMRDTTFQWLYPVNYDEAQVHGDDSDVSDNEGPETGGDGGSCRVCGLMNPNFYHNNHHRLFYCPKCNQMVERPGWTSHRCNQRSLQCHVCTYTTLVPANLRRHIAAKHRPVNSSNSNNNNNSDEEDVGEDDVGEEDKGNEDIGEGEADEENSATKSSFKVQLFGFGKAVMTVMLIMITCSTGTGGLLSMLFQTNTKSDDESDHDDWDWLEPPKRGRGRPRCPPGWLTCDTCGYHAPSKRRLRIHERKHDRQLAKLNQVHFCKYAENKCKYQSRRKSDVTKHEKKCRHKPKVPETLNAETLWDIVSLFPLSNTLAYNFLKMLEKALNFRFLPKYLREDMKTRLNCCMQFLTAEKVQFKVR